LVVAAALTVLVLAAVVAVAPSLYEVEARGKGPPLVPYESSGVVYKVRVLDRFSVYGDSESRPNFDKLSSVALVAAASMSLMALLLLKASGGNARVRRFYGFLTVALAFLAADELLGLHETVGHNLGFLADLPGVDRPDDVVFVSYGVVLAALAWPFRDILLANRRATLMFAGGAALFALAAAGDLTGVAVDEPAEALSAACLGGGLVLLTADLLAGQLGLRQISEPPLGEVAVAPAPPAAPAAPTVLVR
jgi:hypothetical protein